MLQIAPAQDAALLCVGVGGTRLLFGTGLVALRGHIEVQFGCGVHWVLSSVLVCVAPAPAGTSLS